MPRVTINTLTEEEYMLLVKFWDDTVSGSHFWDLCIFCYGAINTGRLNERLIPHKMLKDTDEYKAHPDIGYYFFTEDPIDHPPYEETDYTCDICGEKLIADDNHKI